MGASSSRHQEPTLTDPPAVPSLASSPSGAFPPLAALPRASPATKHLHALLDRFWDTEALSVCIHSSSRPDPQLYVEVHRQEQFFVFCPPAERSTGSFALTALGRFASNLLSHIVAGETGRGESRVDRDLAPRVLCMLLDAGGDPSAPLHARRAAPGAPWAPGAASLVDALRLMVCAAARVGEQVRRARSAFLAPTLHAVLAAVPHVSCVDLVFWAGQPLGGDALALVAAKPVAMPGGARALPSLLAAVDVGSTAALRLLLEGGADPNSEGQRGEGGVTPLMRCTGEWAVVLPPPEGAYGAHRGVNPEAAAVAAAPDAPAPDAAVPADRSNEEPEEVRHRPTRALLEALLHAGADARLADARGRTALHHFAAAPSPALRADPAGRLALALRLLAAGADAEARDAGGATAGEAAAAARPPPADGARFAAGLFAAAKEGGGRAGAAARAAGARAPPPPAAAALIAAAAAAAEAAVAEGEASTEGAEGAGAEV
jgi:hypothetical protein